MKHSQQGFTLIELLGAIVILGILSLLIVPGVQQLRHHTNQLECAGNLRRLVSANHNYALDNDGRYAPGLSHDVTNRIRWHGKRSGSSQPYDSRYGYLSPYFNGGDGIQGTPNPGKFDKNNPFATTGRELECKEFLSYPMASSSFEKAGGSYGYNDAYLGSERGNSAKAFPMQELTEPSRTIMFADTAFARGNSIQEYPMAEPYYEVLADGSLGMQLIPSIHFRHGGKANVAWADGHVTLEKPARLQNEKFKIGWIGPSENNGLWNADR